MSAPWEVRIKHIQPDGAVASLGIVGGTRYLRADLTCGECGHLRDDNDYSVLCVKHSWEIAAENPSCMAFVPRSK